MRLGAQGRIGGLARLWSRPERRLQLLILAAALALVIGVTIAWALRVEVFDREYWKSLGYPGVFFLSFLGSVSMVLPVPGMITLCGVSVLLNPVFLGLLAGTGETIGEVSGYAIGYGGRAVIERRSVYQKIRVWMERRGTLVIFVVSLIPNPFFDLVGIAAGGVRFPLYRFLVTVWAGKTLKSLIVAYLCFKGITLLPWFE